MKKRWKTWHKAKYV